jgi:hypothetical protein
MELMLFSCEPLARAYGKNKQALVGDGGLYRLSVLGKEPVRRL